MIYDKFRVHEISKTQYINNLGIDVFIYLVGTLIYF